MLPGTWATWLKSGGTAVFSTCFHCVKLAPPLAASSVAFAATAGSTQGQPPTAPLVLPPNGSPHEDEQAVAGLHGHCAPMVHWDVVFAP